MASGKDMYGMMMPALYIFCLPTFIKSSPSLRKCAVKFRCCTFLFRTDSWPNLQIAICSFARSQLNWKPNLKCQLIAMCVFGHLGIWPRIKCCSFLLKNKRWLFYFFVYKFCHYVDNIYVMKNENNKMKWRWKWLHKNKNKKLSKLHF